MRYLPLLVLPLLVLALVTGCTTTPVIYQATPVENETQVTAAKAIRAADIVGASIVQFIITGHKQGTVPTEVLQRYNREIGPAFQSALDNAKEGLQRAIETPTEDASVQLLAQVATLLTVLEDAAALAQAYGW